MIGTAAVAAASLATTTIGARLGAGDPGLAFVMGGVVCLNALLFFTPGALGLHPRRLPLVLAANLVPLVTLAWLRTHAEWAAEVVLLLVSFAAVFARSLGSFASALTLTVVLNVLVALLLGGAGGFLVIGAISAVLGSVIAPIADLLTALVLAHLGRFVEHRLLVDAAVLFLEEAGRRWQACWRGPWYEAHARRFAAIADDFVLGTENSAPLLPHLLEAIGRAGQRLHDVRRDLSPGLAAKLGTVWTELAERLGAGAAGEEVTTQLRAMIAGLPVERDSPELAASSALAVTLLLAELAAAARHPRVAGPPRPRARARIGALEWRIAVQTVVCVAVALVVGHLMHAERPYWITLTAVILTSASFGETLRKSFERLLGTLGGLIVGELLWLVLAGHAGWLTGVTLLAVAGLFFARAGAYRWPLFWVTLLLALLLNGAGEASLLVGGRLVDTLVGAAIVIVVTRFLLPVHAARVAERRGKEVLRAIAARLRAGFLEGDETPLRSQLADALAGLRIASDAESLEAGHKRTTRNRIARRAAAADRIAGAFLCLDSVPVGFRPEADTRAAIEATGNLAEVAADTGIMLPFPDVPATMRELMGRARADPAPGEGLRLELRVLALLRALGEAIGALVEAIEACGTPRPVPTGAAAETETG